jgi:hypothetical protein
LSPNLYDGGHGWVLHHDDSHPWYTGGVRGIESIRNILYYT